MDTTEDFSISDHTSPLLGNESEVWGVSRRGARCMTDPFGKRRRFTPVEFSMNRFIGVPRKSSKDIEARVSTQTVASKVSARRGSIFGYRPDIDGALWLWFLRAWWRMTTAKGYLESSESRRQSWKRVFPALQCLALLLDVLRTLYQTIDVVPLSSQMWLSVLEDLRVQTNFIFLCVSVVAIFLPQHRLVSDHLLVAFATSALTLLLYVRSFHGVDDIQVVESRLFVFIMVFAYVGIHGSALATAVFVNALVLAFLAGVADAFEMFCQGLLIVFGSEILSFHMANLQGQVSMLQDAGNGIVAIDVRTYTIHDLDQTFARTAFSSKNMLKGSSFLDILSDHDRDNFSKQVHAQLQGESFQPINVEFNVPGTQRRELIMLAPFQLRASIVSYCAFHVPAIGMVDRDHSQSRTRHDDETTFTSWTVDRRMPSRSERSDVCPSYTLSVSSVSSSRFLEGHPCSSGMTHLSPLGSVAASDDEDDEQMSISTSVDTRPDLSQRSTTLAGSKLPPLPLHPAMAGLQASFGTTHLSPLGSVAASDDDDDEQMSGSASIGTQTDLPQESTNIAGSKLPPLPFHPQASNGTTHLSPLGSVAASDCEDDEQIKVSASIGTQTDLPQESTTIASGKPPPLPFHPATVGLQACRVSKKDKNAWCKQFRSTSLKTVRTLLLDVIPKMNPAGKACCCWHLSLATLSIVVQKLAAHTCSFKDGLMLPLDQIWQCSTCLALNETDLDASDDAFCSHTYCAVCMSPRVHDRDSVGSDSERSQESLASESIASV
eukprot:TRINITY_DN4384_c0_g1_i1.p1 TRINITY_DN4384_c0_g1~~TRINITY_DN4384_c0_g1_i1.p1  ORF type:complete len:775 (-),score=74.46 TRINITY_DN4384_c0_g1_i1:114-2438(-)